MSTEIKIWQVGENGLATLDTTLAEEGRDEPNDLQGWIRATPAILGGDVVIIGEQVQTRSGPMDFLAIDGAGNTVVVELKRGRLPREALVQAIDYASDVANWDLDRLNEECLLHHKQPLEAYLNDTREDMDIEDVSWNNATRILLVGTEVEEALQRMVEWLAESFGMSINAILFKYVKTEGGDELLARTMIIPEEVEKERSQRQGSKIPMSDEPGSYDEGELRDLLGPYLSQDRRTPRRIRRYLLPLCLEHGTVTRDRLKQELVTQSEADDEGQAGMMITGVSRELGFKSRDYLRQVIRYDKPRPWEKENYRIEEDHEQMVRELLEELASTATE